MRQAADRLLIGGYPRGNRCGPFEERHRACRLAAALEMDGDRRADLVEAPGMDQLHALRDAPVNQPPPRRTDAAIGDFPDAVVAEVPPFIRLHADDVAAPELVERPHEGIL